MKKLKCHKCGKEFLRPLDHNGYRKRLNGHIKNYCSYSCYLKGGETVNVTLINVLCEKVKAKELLEQEIADIKKEIEKELPEEGFKNDQVTISHKKASETVSVDLKAFEKKEPELYKELLADYTKVTKRSASVSYTFKKEKE